MHNPSKSENDGDSHSLSVPPPPFPHVPSSLAPIPLFTVDLKSTIGSEYAGMIEDAIRMISLQLIIQIMLYFGNATDKVFSEDLFVLMFYIVLGVAFFWLVIKSLVSFQ